MFISLAASPHFSLNFKFYIQAEILTSQFSDLEWIAVHYFLSLAGIANKNVFIQISFLLHFFIVFSHFYCKQ